MAIQEYECHDCNSTFVIRDGEPPTKGTEIACPRCKSRNIEPYFFPRDACRLYNLVKPDA